MGSLQTNTLKEIEYKELRSYKEVCLKRRKGFPEDLIVIKGIRKGFQHPARTGWVIKLNRCPVDEVAILLWLLRTNDRTNEKGGQLQDRQNKMDVEMKAQVKPFDEIY